jgi:clan AA aspartic protease
MNGVVDDFGRPLVRISLRNPGAGITLELDAWIDTGFGGSLMLPTDHVTRLALLKSGEAVGGLADGSRVNFDTYGCHINWFEAERRVEALASTGRFALIGLGLLEDYILTINYPRRTVTVAQSAEPPAAP